ncbi:hypothetical protein [Maribacter sp. Asnod1-A12]|uniref:hypothetical protein n=1 Tax=Maribacter sp. Asnod1-A12 TaxID=3160576 RepID=UPI00386533B4
MNTYLKNHLYSKNILHCLCSACIILFFATNINSQSVGINTLTPDPSAALDIQSTTGGLLIPRMTETEILALVSPPDGLMIYNTDVNNMVMFVQGGPYELYNRSATATASILSGLTPSLWAGINNLTPTELLGLEIYRFQLDLTEVREMRVVANVFGLTITGPNTLDIALQYSTNGGSTWNYLNGTSFGPGVSISVNGLVTTPWVEIDTAAQQDVQLRLVGMSNESAVTLQVGFGLVMAEMR